MGEQTRKALAYVSDFLTFLFLERGVAEKIVSAHLFGSAVREELSEGSDIDVFLACPAESEKTLLEAARRAEKRFRSSKDFDKWHQMGFTYPLSIKAGPLEEWGLKESIAAEGIGLYSQSSLPGGLERVVLFQFNLPKSKPAYLRLTRELFGRSEEGYKVPGVVGRAGGKRLGAGVFLVPKAAQQTVISVLHRHKAGFSMHELFRRRQP